MRTSILTAAAIVAAATSPALAASRTYDVAPFQEISVSAGVTAIVEVGSAQRVEAEAASDSVLNRLRVEVRGNTLELGVEWNFLGWVFNLGQPREITVRVSAPAITSGEASSGAALDVAGMTGDRLSLESSSGATVDARGLVGGNVMANASSGANLKAAGECTDIHADASSGAQLDASAVACEAAEANVSSGANVRVRATRAIDADASSGGGITVYGKPTDIEVDSNSGGWIDFAD